ncbi:MAG: hypothetical protein ACI9QL_000611 [Candidatus Omnitrophota bacterium]|jgi:hypothetical protein
MKIQKYLRTVISLSCMLFLWNGCGSNERVSDADPERMRMRLSAIAVETAESNAYMGKEQLEWLRREPLRVGVIDQSDQLFGLGYQELIFGNEAAAIATLNEAWRISKSAKEAAYNANQSLLYLGISHLRMGEIQNCCEQNTPDSCILPIQGGGLHSRPEGSQSAIACFEEYLGRVSPSEINFHTAKWLLNLAHMTLGTYPGGVPEVHRIDPAHFELEPGFPKFHNIAEELGLDTYSLSGGVIIDDFNNDDLLDILTSTWDPSGELSLFLNSGHGTFTRQSNAEVVLTGLFGGLNMVQGDYNNDGFVDVFVFRGAWLAENGKHPNSLLRNNGPNKQGKVTFTDVTFQAQLAIENNPTQSGGWADYDNDGDLDLYVGNETSSSNHAPSQLFRNNGANAQGYVTFTDVAREAGVSNMGFTKGVTWGDYDADGWMDLYVSNLGGHNRLYHNRGDGTFQDEAPAMGVAGPWRSFPAWFWDYNNDGVLDLFCSNYPIEPSMVAAYYSNPKTDDALLCGFYQGQLNAPFKNVAREVRVDRPMMPMGANFGDLDNDGFLDFYLGTGNPDYSSLMPNQMFVSQGGTWFKNVTLAGGFGHLQKGHGIAFADLDHDGDLDIMEQMGGAFPGDKYYDTFYENPGFGNQWLTVQLVGVQSNRSAIGARLKIVTESGGETQTVYRHVSSGGSFGASPLRQTIGLGRAEKIVSLEVLWPATHKVQTFHDVQLNQLIRITEDKSRISIIRALSTPYKTAPRS